MESICNVSVCTLIRLYNLSIFPHSYFSIQHNSPNTNLINVLHKTLHLNCTSHDCNHVHPYQQHYCNEMVAKVACFFSINQIDLDNWHTFYRHSKNQTSLERKEINDSKFSPHSLFFKNQVYLHMKSQCKCLSPSHHQLTIKTSKLLYSEFEMQSIAFSYNAYCYLCFFLRTFCQPVCM